MIDSFPGLDYEFPLLLSSRLFPSRPSKHVAITPKLSVSIHEGHRDGLYGCHVLAPTPRGARRGGAPARRPMRACTSIESGPKVLREVRILQSRQFPKV